MLQQSSSGRTLDLLLANVAFKKGGGWRGVVLGEGFVYMEIYEGKGFRRMVFQEGGT